MHIDGYCRLEKATLLLFHSIMQSIFLTNAVVLTTKGIMSPIKVDKNGSTDVAGLERIASCTSAIS